MEHACIYMLYLLHWEIKLRSFLQTFIYSVKNKHGNILNKKYHFFRTKPNLVRRVASLYTCKSIWRTALWLSRLQLFVTLLTIAHQAFLSVGFSRQEYWSELSFPFPGNLPYPGIEPLSPVLQVDFLPLSHGGSICLKRRQLDSDLLLYLIGCTITLMSKLHSYSGENESEKGK